MRSKIKIFTLVFIYQIVMIAFKCKLRINVANLLSIRSGHMNKKTRAPQFESLISSPWAKSQDNSYYGDPRYVNKEQHGLEDIVRDKTDEDGVEQVVILGYN